MVDNIEKSVHFIVTFHFHQPIDNYNWVFSDVYEKCYSLLLDQMIAHPLIKFTLHFTGSLLDWYEANLPEFIDKVKLLASRGQIEIIGGGYYEPIFAIIPPRDRLRQMELLRDRIKELFGVTVQGAGSLSACGNRVIRNSSLMLVSSMSLSMTTTCGRWGSRKRTLIIVMQPKTRVPSFGCSQSMNLSGISHHGSPLGK